MNLKVRPFYDKDTATLTYLVWDIATRDAVVIDPVLDYDPVAAVASDDSLTKMAAHIGLEKLNIQYILETHAHADHISGSERLRVKFPDAKIAIGARVTEVQKVCRELFDLPRLAIDGSQFDHLLNDREVFSAGSLEVEVHFTPGHTPACASYLIGNNLFTGDALFMPDSGVGRCDFPGGNAERLFDSVTQRIYSLPDTTRIFTGHDYLPNGRQLRCESSITEEKRSNIHLNATTTKSDFVKFRNDRDQTLTLPRLLYPSLQINMDGGRLPAPHANGKRYLAIPIKFKND